MLIDAHNHLGGPDKGDGKSQSPEEILASMDRSAIERAIVFPFNMSAAFCSQTAIVKVLSESEAGITDNIAVLLVNSPIKHDILTV